MVFLQENHSNQTNEIDWGGLYTLIHGTNLSGWGGVAVLSIKRINPRLLSTVELVKERCLIVRIEI